MTEKEIVSVVERLVQRMNDLEVKLDNLRVQFDVHGHAELLKHQAGCEHATDV